MANTLKIKRSAVEGKVPLVTDLQLGELAVNTYDGKLFLKRDDGLNQYIVEVGGNVGFEVKNQTGSTIPKGTVVRFAGTLGASGKLLITPFLADGTYPSEYVVGIVENDIVDGGDGFAIDHGKIFNLNTSAFSQGDILYASATSAGALTSSRPQAPNNKIVVAAVINSNATTGILEVRLSIGSQLSNDELVELSTLTNNDIIAYNSSNSRFQNTQLKTINSQSLIGSGNITISGGGVQPWSVKTANYTASAGDRIITDTTLGSFTITLPATPSAGDSVAIADGADWVTYPVTVARNSNTIEGLSDNLVLDIPGIQVEFIYDGSTWEVYAFTGPSGVEIDDDIATSSAVYPTWTPSISGYQNLKVSSNKFSFQPSTGNLTVAGDLNSNSDIRLKSNIVNIENALSTINSIRGVTFDMNGKRRLGVIAQEIEQFVPEVISTNPEGYLTVAYGNLVGLLIESTKELSNKIKQLEKKLEEKNNGEFK
jgi:hypothetical protein